MTADEEFETALAATVRFADAWRTRTAAHADSTKPQSLHVARVPDGKHVSLTEPQLRAVLDGLERLRAETQQTRALMPKLFGLAWRNGWSDRAQAQQDVVQQANRRRDEHERRFVAEAKGWISELDAELAAGVVPQRPETGGTR